jgi:transposase
MVIDRTRARHRLGKFLLRHGRVWREGEAWALKHQAWVASQRFGDKAMEATFAHYRATLEAREAAVERQTSPPGSGGRLSPTPWRASALTGASPHGGAPLGF